MMHERSEEEVTSNLLSEEKLTQFTGAQCPSNVTIGFMSPIGRVSGEKVLLEVKE